jgi:fructose-1,6-bisphosphatase/inositol monophosphatase family enzyme
MAENVIQINEHIIGIILKELVRRAMVIARRQILSFEVSGKMGYGGEMDDFFTSADSQAQESYVRSLQECFPGIGIIGEEDSLVVFVEKGWNAYFTIDPIDGTKAYIRRQSHGVGSMIALIIDGVIEAAFIGDINSREIFGYRPGSSNVWRITDLEAYEKLDSNPPETIISGLSILLREREQKYSEVSRRTIDGFKTVLVDGGSIGTWAARLWKREVGALLLYPSWETPWDSSPVIGISKKLGYVFLRPFGFKNGWMTYEPEISREKFWRAHETLIIHKNHLEAFHEHCADLK